MKIVKRNAYQRTKTLYGRRMSGYTQVSNENLASEESVKINKSKFLGAALLKMNLPHPVDVIELTFEENGIRLREYIELDTVRDEEELKRDNEIFKTLETVLNKRDIRGIETRYFVKEIFDELNGDARFAYKGFERENFKNTVHSVYIYTLLALVVATVSLANEFDFESPMRVFMKKRQIGVELKFKMETSRPSKELKREELLKNSRFESKLAYLHALCQREEIKSSVKSVGTLVTFDYLIKEAPPEAPRVYAREDEQRRVFKALLDAFNPPSCFFASDDSEEQ